MPERELLEFAEGIQAEVLTRAGKGEEDTAGVAGASDYKENVFTRLIVENLAEAGVVDDADVCFYSGRLGNGIARVNGYGISDGEDRVDLFATVYIGSGSAETASWETLQKVFKQAVRFLTLAFTGRHADMEPSSEAYAMAERIHSLRGQLANARIFVLTDGKAAHNTLEQETIGSLPVSGQIWDIERLYRNLASGRPHEAIEIDLMRECGQFITCLPVPSDGLDYGAYLCVIPGEVLFSLYEEYGGRLLELNVRSFLQARGKVNKGIRETIRDDPTHFFPYNNGLSMTAAAVNVERMPDGSQAITHISGLQIVNGGQTTASIHRARKADRFDIRRVFVQGKLTTVSGNRLEEMVPRISKYANSQNAVNEADFSANHPVHIELERLSLTTWMPGEQGRWFYERARGQYQVARAREGTSPLRLQQFDQRTPKNRTFTKTDLAKYLNTWDLKPHIVSRGGQKNFIAFQDALRGRGRGWLPEREFFEDLVAKALLFRYTQKIVADEGYDAYRANIVTYTLALLVDRTNGHLDLEHIWTSQEVPEQIQRTLRRWSRQVSDEIRQSAGERNIGEWCKKEDCWIAVRALGVQLPAELLRHVQQAADAHDGERPSREELENIAACRRVSSEAWMEVHQWAVREGRLNYPQRGVVLTMSSHARSGWPEQTPTAKQAKTAMKAYRTAVENGLVE